MADEPMKILVTCDLGRAALDIMNGGGNLAAEVRDIRDSAVLAAAVPGFDGLIVRSNVKVTAEVIASADRLKVIGRAGIGVDNIDMEAATAAGIAVVNAPAGNTVTTAEHAMAMLLSMARRIPQATASMKRREWEKKRFMGTELRGKTLGVAGAGRIGSVVAEIALGLRMKVICADPLLTAARAEELGVEKVGMDELFSRADFITVHAPLTNETRGLVGREMLSRVRRGVMIVNCARGPIVDLDALLEAIGDGRVAGAALDVFPEEPPPHHPLYDREEVVLTPHLGASTVEAQEWVSVEIAENMVSFLVKGASPNTLNLPNISPELFARLGPHIELAKKLGLMASQVAGAGVDSVKFEVGGKAGEEGLELLASAFLAGLLKRSVETANIVNSRSLAKARGMLVATSATTRTGDFTELLSAEVAGGGEVHVLEGTLFRKKEPRLVFLDGFHLEAVPEGHMIMVFNNDRPGVIGDIGTCLGANGINIAGFYNGRQAVGGRALTLVTVDEPAGEKVLEELRSLPNILSVRQMKL